MKRKHLPKAKRIRKQFMDLTEQDLQVHPVWELALDEEGERGQDEETVRPLDVQVLPRSEPRSVVCAARALLRDGRALPANLSLWFPATPSEAGFMKLSEVQPYLLVGGVWYMFWHGVLEPKRAYMDRFYEALGSTPEEIFPIEVVAAVRIEGETFYRRTVITGFEHYADFQSNAVIERK